MLRPVTAALSMLLFVVCSLSAIAAEDPRAERVENGLLPPVLVEGGEQWNVLDRLGEAYLAAGEPRALKNRTTVLYWFYAQG